jgi:predicted DsbA family dithiol-disulfide isomerase
MRIEIWSDVVCPWCYIGKRRLEKALADFPHAEEVEILWRSFQLDPGAPQEPVETVAASLGRKYGGGADAGKQMIGTMDAHRLLHLALHDGGPALQGELKEALFSAYFTQAINIADHRELRRIATEVGLDATAVDRVLGSDEYAEEVWADIAQAQAYGATGVPFFVLDQKFGVSGAQPADSLRQVLDRAWAERTPTVQMLGGGEECGPDGCAI